VLGIYGARLKIENATGIGVAACLASAVAFPAVEAVSYA